MNVDLNLRNVENLSIRIFTFSFRFEFTLRHHPIDPPINQEML